MNPMQQLRDIHLPDPVSWWPLAYGWWLLGVFTLVTLAVSIVWWHRRRRRLKARREALQTLAQVDASASDWPMQLNQLLKQAAMSYLPPEQVASLCLDDWQRFTTSLLPPKKQQPFADAMTTLQQSLYRGGTTSADFHTIATQCRIWLTHALPVKRNRRQDV